MVWACISSFEVRDPIFIDGTLNKEYYLQILKGSPLQCAVKMDIAGRLKLYRQRPQICIEPRPGLVAVSLSKIYAPASLVTQLEPNRELLR